MTHFEFLTVALSFVLGLAVTVLLSSLLAAFRAIRSIWFGIRTGSDRNCDHAPDIVVICVGRLALDQTSKLAAPGSPSPGSRRCRQFHVCNRVL